MTKILLGAGLLLAATAAGAQAAPLAAQPSARDGIQTRAEVVQRARTMFARVDTNRDGFITQAERQAVRGQMRQRMTRAADPARRAEMFARLDTNRDNMISRDEWTRAEALRGQRGAEGRRGGMGGQRMAMRGRMGGAMLRMADTNRDQRISLAEAETAALQRFDRVDLNRDGRVTREERQQARQQRGAMQRG
ncbi:EF-hand domain-containing protein [Sphingomonas glaciei]|uniref:EF-hand domain-containing protein n=1 Tax=Sphingomonas glaciei TaxID=2938948 RepID=A0ABY5MU81_9SPHN|nr:EF-hand domain-containing protein [Sphingomonas glaciei]UUR07529.1 EF-hand domain-containing protein [Sphingomonas glaciei]